MCGCNGMDGMGPDEHMKNDQESSIVRAPLLRSGNVLGPTHEAHPDLSEMQEVITLVPR
jgi:hypothetical protein